MRNLLCFCLLMTASVITKAQDTATIRAVNGWYHIWTTAKSEKLFVKADVVTNEYDEIKIWTKIVMPTITVKKVLYKNAEVRSLIICNCKQKTMQYVRSIFYSSTGKLLDQYEHYKPMEEVIPETVGETMFNFICATFNN